MMEIHAENSKYCHHTINSCQKQLEHNNDMHAGQTYINSQ